MGRIWPFAIFGTAALPPIVFDAHDARPSSNRRVAPK